MKRKPFWILVCILSVTALLLGCAGGQKSVELRPVVPLENISSETVSPASFSQTEEQEETMLVRVGTGIQSVIFQLNDSTAAKAFYGQLPLTLPVENYGTNEKIVYPPEKLDVSDTPMAEGPAGTLAYYAPWGDVAMFYGECGGASGLFELGEAVSGIDRIKTLSGEIRIEKITREDLNLSLSETGIPEAEDPAQNGPNRPNRLEDKEPQPVPQTSKPGTEEDNMTGFTITIGNQSFPAKLYQSETAQTLAARFPLTLDMSELNGNEKYAYLDRDLPSNPSSPSGIRAGDLMLYGSDCLVLFYESFPTSYSYTLLGYVENPEGLADALGSRSVQVTFQLER